jgi:putative nucleotidyltransferase with HDIG domain
MSRILIAEGDESVRGLYRAILEPHGYKVVEAAGMDEAQILLKQEQYSLFLLDLHLLDRRDEAIAVFRDREGNMVPVVVATGYGSMEQAVQAIKKGANDFIAKPFNVQTLLSVVERNTTFETLSQELSQLRMITSIFQLNKIIISLTAFEELVENILALLMTTLSPVSVIFYSYDDRSSFFFLRGSEGKVDSNEPHTISFSDLSSQCSSDLTGEEVIHCDNGIVLLPLQGKQHTIGLFRFSFGGRKISFNERKFLSVLGAQISIAFENTRLLDEARQSYFATICTLINSLEAKDAYTKGHSEQVAFYAIRIARTLGFSEDKLENVRNAAYLHDLGKIGIKDDIILKEGPLSSDEYEIIKEHPRITMNILQPLKMKKEELDACLYHHEQLDGTGYPEGLKDKEIPVMAKILSVADAFSAMTSERPYRKKKMSQEEALRELQAHAGSQFDPKIVRVFASILKESTDSNYS